MKKENGKETLDNQLTPHSNHHVRIEYNKTGTEEAVIGTEEATEIGTGIVIGTEEAGTGSVIGIEEAIGTGAVIGIEEAIGTGAGAVIGIEEADKYNLTLKIL